MTQLPKGWVLATVGDLLAPLDDGRLVHQGWSPQCEREPAPDNNWGVLKTTAIQAGRFLAAENKRLPEPLEPRPVLEVQSGDLLLTCAGPRARCGVACLVRDTRRRLMISGKMYRFRVDLAIADPRFIEFSLLSPDRVNAIDEMKTGISDSGLNLTHARFRALQLPVAPLPEQRRIVAAIEEAFSELDAGEAGLRNVRQLLKRMRDAVLTAAVTGRLVPQDPTDTPATKLLADLGVGTTDHESPAEHPDGWSWTTLGEGVGNDSITDGPFGSNLKSEHYTESGPRVVRLQNIGDGSFRDAAAYISDEHFARLRKHEVAPGDVLVATLGEVLPRACVAPPWLGPAIVKADCIRVRPGGAFNGSFLEIALNSHPVRTSVSGSIKGVGRPRLNLGELRRLVLPVPPLSEQLRIVAEVERQLSFVDACERVVDVGLARSAALRRSVLKAAFEGRLVPQDPEDEPASVLLERVRRSRLATGRAEGRRNRRHTPSVVSEA